MSFVLTFMFTEAKNPNNLLKRKIGDIFLAEKHLGLARDLNPLDADGMDYLVKLLLKADHI